MSRKKQSIYLLPWKPSISRIHYYKNRKKWLCFLTAHTQKLEKKDKVDDLNRPSAATGNNKQGNHIEKGRWVGHS